MIAFVSKASLVRLQCYIMNQSVSEAQLVATDWVTMTAIDYPSLSTQLVPRMFNNNVNYAYNLYTIHGERRGTSLSIWRMFECLNVDHPLKYIYLNLWMDSTILFCLLSRSSNVLRAHTGLKPFYEEYLEMRAWINEWVRRITFYSCAFTRRRWRK